MAISPSELIKELRERTQAGMMDCKEALSASDNDLEKAIDYLRKKGLTKAAKKAGRATNEGLVSSYIHAGGKIGVLVEIVCETDFVAKNEIFQTFCRDVAMHIAAANPAYLERAQVPAGIIERERAIAMEQMAQSGKPAAVLEKIVDGKIDKTIRELCLLDQPFIKDATQTIQEYLTSMIAKIGENIVIRRFCRFQVGEG